ncbi:hypothetical protein V6N13_137663 [Hibiscus sabdariffa]
MLMNKGNRKGRKARKQPYGRKPIYIPAVTEPPDVLEPAGKGLENGTDAEDVQEQHANEHDGVECTTGAHVEAGADISADVFEPDDHVAGSNEAQGGVLAGLTSGARVEAGAGISIDVLEPAGRGLENGDDAEAVQEQHTNEHNGVECTVGAHVEAGADISADVFEPAGGGLENGVDAEAVQEQHANEQNVDDVELQAESGGCTRVQGCWAVKKVVCEPKVYKKEVWAIETSMLRRLFYINAAKSSSVAHSSSASITSKKKSLVFLGSPQVSATVLDALFNASAAASSFEVCRRSCWAGYGVARLGMGESAADWLGSAGASDTAAGLEDPASSVGAAGI